MSAPELPPNYSELDLLTRLTLCSVCGVAVPERGSLLHDAWHSRVAVHEQALQIANRTSKGYYTGTRR